LEVKISFLRPLDCASNDTFFKINVTIQNVKGLKNVMSSKRAKKVSSVLLEWHIKNEIKVRLDAQKPILDPK
jgi:hypothetical protein